MQGTVSRTTLEESVGYQSIQGLAHMLLVEIETAGDEGLFEGSVGIEV